METLRFVSVPNWIQAAQQKQLEKRVEQVELRNEQRMRFNRETGYYEW